MKLRRPLLGILGVAVVSILYGVAGARAQQPQQLTPYLGETKAQFEARKAGLPQPDVAPDAFSVSILADPKGSFFVESTVNSTPIRMMVDTGANYVALSETDARSAGFDLSPADFKVKVSTANGAMFVAPVLLKEIAVGEIVVSNVPAIVVPENKLGISLLGMSFLSKLSYFNEKDGRLTLKR